MDKRILGVYNGLKEKLKGRVVLREFLSDRAYYKKEGAIIPPWYYGRSYRDFCMDSIIYHPIPLNYMVRWGMMILYLWNRFRNRPSWIEKQVQATLKNRQRTNT